MGEAKRRKALDPTFGVVGKKSSQGLGGQPDFGSAIYEAAKDIEFELTDFGLGSSGGFSGGYSESVKRYSLTFTPSMFSLRPAILPLGEPHMLTIEWYPAYRPLQPEKEMGLAVATVRNGARLKPRKDWEYKDTFKRIVLPCELLTP
jgi:hypothetical protein